MTESPDGALWFATAGGISRWKHGSWKHWTKEQRLLTERVFTIASDSSGTIWFGDQNNGVGMIDPSGSVKYVTSRDGLVSDAVWGIRVDDANRLWCATVAGLMSYQDGIWSTFDVTTGLNSVRLWPILVTPDVLYVGTRSGGVAILDLHAARGSAQRIVPSPPIIERGSIFARWKVYSRFGEIPFQNIECRIRLDDRAWSEWSFVRDHVFGDVSAGTHTVTIQSGFGHCSRCLVSKQEHANRRCPLDRHCNHPSRVHDGASAKTAARDRAERVPLSESL
jgi:hypothetical protein